jgi:hypothetical protein
VYAQIGFLEGGTDLGTLGSQQYAIDRLIQKLSGFGIQATPPSQPSFDALLRKKVNIRAFDQL